MVSSLVMGIAVAIGRDRFYAAYNGKSVNNGLEQKVIHNVGAAFAIMVKMFLAISTGVVFTRHLWMSPDYNNTEFFYLPSTAEPTCLLPIACTLRNATYDIDLNYQNTHQSTHQNVNVRSVILSNEVTISPVLLADDYAGLVYNAIQFAFNDIVIASATTSDASSSAGYNGGSVYASPLRQHIEGSPHGTTAEIEHVLEELFQNITISMLSSPSFQLPDSKAVPMNITTWYSQNVYAYEPTDLYIAYGSAVVCTLACVLWGCYILHHSQASYSTDFSTILRTTRRRQFDELVPREAHAGDAPLPPYIKTRRLIYMAHSDVAEGGFALVGPAPNPEGPLDPVSHEYAKIGSLEISEVWQYESTSDGAVGERIPRVQQKIRRKSVTTSRPS